MSGSDTKAENARREIFVLFTSTAESTHRINPREVSVNPVGIVNPSTVKEVATVSTRWKEMLVAVTGASENEQSDIDTPSPPTQRINESNPNSSGGKTRRSCSSVTATVDEMTLLFSADPITESAAVSVALYGVSGGGVGTNVRMSSKPSFSMSGSLNSTESTILTFLTSPVILASEYANVRHGLAGSPHPSVSPDVLKSFPGTVAWAVATTTVSVTFCKSLPS